VIAAVGLDQHETGALLGGLRHPGVRFRQGSFRHLGLGFHCRNRVTQGGRCGHGRDFRSERFAQAANGARM